MKRLVLAYRHSNSKSDCDLYTAYYNGFNWGGNTQIKEQEGELGVNFNSHSSPSMVLYDNLLYMAYNPNSDDSIYIAWQDWGKWSGGIPIREMNGGIDPKCATSPTMVLFKGLIYIIYKDLNTTDIMTACFDGTSWYNNEKIKAQGGGISPTSLYRPAAVVYNDLLYIIYTTANNSEGYIYYSYFDGINWYMDEKVIIKSSNVSPRASDRIGACIYNNQILITYVPPDEHEIYTATFNGSKWEGGTAVSSQAGGIKLKSKNSCAPIVFNSKLYLLYSDYDSIYLASAWYNGSQWYGGSTINDQQGGITPISDFAPGFVLLLDICRAIRVG